MVLKIRFEGLFSFRGFPFLYWRSREEASCTERPLHSRPMTGPGEKKTHSLSPALFGVLSGKGFTKTSTEKQTRFYIASGTFVSVPQLGASWTETGLIAVFL